MKRATFVVALSIALPLTALADIDLHRDTIVPAAIDNELSITRNQAGDLFTATVVDYNYDVPAGTHFEGHIVNVRPPERDHSRGSMRLHFDSMVLPDGSRVPIDAVPIPLDARGVRRDRAGRLSADE